MPIIREINTSLELESNNTNNDRRKALAILIPNNLEKVRLTQILASVTIVLGVGLTVDTRYRTRLVLFRGKIDERLIDDDSTDNAGIPFFTLNQGGIDPFKGVQTIFDGHIVTEGYHSIYLGSPKSPVIIEKGRGFGAILSWTARFDIPVTPGDVQTYRSLSLLGFEERNEK